MPGKHNKCCCSPTPTLYVGTLGSSTIYGIDSATGAYSIFNTGTLSTARRITCDPSTGNIYVASGLDSIYCLNSSGTPLWTVSRGAGAAISDVCVSNDGYVYAAFTRSGGTGAILKLDAATGVGVTSGWPYIPDDIWGVTTGASFNCVCVDQSGNVYAGGANALHTGRAISLTSGGSVRWTSVVENTPALSAFAGVEGLAINAGGTTLIAMRRTDVTEPAVDSHYFLDATTGTVNSSFRPTSGTGVAADGCDYGPSGIAYSTNTSSNASVADVFADTSPFFNTHAFTTQAVTCIRNGGVFVTAQADTGTPAANYNVWNCDGSWKILLPASTLMYTIESSEGRIGAFGL